MIARDVQLDEKHAFLTAASDTCNYYPQAPRPTGNHKPVPEEVKLYNRFSVSLSGIRKLNLMQGKL